MRARVLLLSLLVAVVTPIGARASHINVTVGPLAEAAPARTHLVGRIENFNVIVLLEFGDGSLQTWFNNGQTIPPFDVEITHEYNCPGTYPIKITTYNGIEWHEKTWTVSVGLPQPLVVSGGAEGALGRVFTDQAEMVVRADRATVDWGDGSGPAEFSWVPDDGAYQSPPHAYAAAGDYLVTVTHHFFSPQCGISLGASVVLTVENPTPVSNTTWGRVKALYR